MKKFIIVVCSIIIISISLPTLSAVNFERTLLQSKFYKTILDKNNAYERFLQTDPNFFNAIFKSLSGGSEEDKETEAGKAQVVSVIKKISPKALQNAIEMALDNIFTGVISQGEKTFDINLSEIKSSVIAQSPIKGETELINSLSDNYSLSIPLELNLASKITSFIKKAVWPIWIFCLLLFILIWLLEPGWRERVRTTGIVAFIFAVLTLALPAFIMLIPSPEISAEIKALVADLFKDAKSNILRLFVKEIIIIGGIGVLLIIISFFIPKSREKVVVAPHTENPKVS